MLFAYDCTEGYCEENGAEILNYRNYHTEYEHHNTCSAVGIEF